METVIAAAVLAAGLVIAALLLVKRAPGLVAAGTAPSSARPASAPAKETAAAKTETDDALARRQEIGRLEERLVSRESAIDIRIAELDAREVRLEERLQETARAHRARRAPPSRPRPRLRARRRMTPTPAARRSAAWRSV